MSSLFQIVIGFTGLIGILLRFIGPLTIAPTITLVGVALFHVAADHAGKLLQNPVDVYYGGFHSLTNFSFVHRKPLGNFYDVSIYNNVCSCDFGCDGEPLRCPFFLLQGSRSRYFR